MISLHADLRNLQAPDNADRGIGQFTRCLLRQARNFAPDEIELVGLTDRRLLPVDPYDRSLLDATLDLTEAPARTGIFVQPSPMTANQSVVLRFLRDRSVTKATVVYDFIPHDCPERYFNSAAERLNYRTALFYLFNYDLFFPISEYSRARLMELIGVDAARAITIGAPIRQTLRNASGTPARRDKPYFLTVVGDDWRKNVEAPLAAFTQLADHHPDLTLEIVGRYSAERQAAILNGTPGPLRRRVHFHSGLTDGALAELYGGAVATICPSRVEGFSLPVVEALTCGSPVLASDCAAQVELIADRDALFAPDDVERLAGLMSSLLAQPLRRDALFARQLPVAEKFAEETVAEKFWRPIYAAHAERAIRAPSVSRRARPRLAVLTPYPPEASGVSDFSARTLPAVAALADIDLFTDSTGPFAVAPGMRHAGKICSFPYFSRAYDRVVSVVGNSHFHSGIVDYLADFGGACIQHDNRMADFYFHLRGPAKFAELLKRAGRKPVSHAEALAGLLTPAIFGTLFFDDIVHAAAPFMVHSEIIARNVKAQYGVDPVVLPFTMMRDFSAAEFDAAHRRAVRERLGIAPDTVAAITLGIPAESKGNVECIEAIAELRRDGINAALYIVGEPSHHVRHLRKVAASRRVKNFVRFMPRRPSETLYRDYIVAADFCIQLRTTGLGGVSAALLDAIAAGLPSVASADLIDAMAAPSYVRRVPDAPDASAVAAQARIIVGNGMRRALGPERDDYLAARSPARYARDLMEALGFAV